MAQEHQDKILPIRLLHFIDLFVGPDNHCRALPNPDIAELIKLIDPTETICHIEEPCLLEGRGHHFLWKKQYWIHEAERQYRMREQSSRDRAYYNSRKEIWHKLTDSLCRLTGIDEDTCRNLALELINKKQWQVIKGAHGIDCAEFAKMEEPKIKVI